MMKASRSFAIHINRNPSSAADENTYLNDAGERYDDGSILHSCAFTGMFRSFFLFFIRRNPTTKAATAMVTATVARNEEE